MWSPESKDLKPEPATYNVLPPSTEEYLKNLLGVSCWKLQLLKDKYAARDSLPMDKRKTLDREMKDDYPPLLHKVKELRKKLAEIQAEKTVHTSKYPTPIKPAFASTSKRLFQVPDTVQEAPTFYRSSKDWDFGTDSRVRTIDMSAFKYTDAFKEGLERERLTDVDMMTGLARPKSRCRKTDFHGPNAEARHIAAPVGQYSPELLPPPRVSRTANATSRRSGGLGQTSLTSTIGLGGSRKSPARSLPSDVSAVSDLSFT